MKSSLYTTLTLTTLTALTVPLLASDIAWKTDLPQALAQAAQEEKKVLILFTASDWCSPCKELEKHVLSTPEFAQYVQESLILVELDYPQGKQTAELARTNAALAEKYQVRGFPTILILDASGVAQGGFVGSRKDMASLKQALAPAFEANEQQARALLLARSATGLAKAQALQMAYEASSEVIKKHNAFLLEEAKAIDTDDTLNIRKQERIAADLAKKLSAERIRIHQRLDATGSDIAEGLNVLSEELKAENIDPSIELSLLTLKRELLFITAETPEDILALQQFLKEEFAKRVPAQAEQIIAFADVLPSQTEALLERARRQRQAIMEAKKDQP